MNNRTKWLPRVFSLLCALMLLCVAVPALGDDLRVIDEANLLTAAEEALLETEIARLRSECGMDVAIVTKNSIGGRDVLRYAADYYDEYGMGAGREKDGLIFLITMAERDYATSTCGRAIEIFTDYGLDEMHSAVQPYLTRGEYADGFEKYLRLVRQCLDYYAENGVGYDRYARPMRVRTLSEALVSWIPIILIVSAVLTLIVILTMKGKTKSVRKKQNAADYISAFRVTGSSDQFINRTTVKRRIETSSSGSHGGRGGSSTFRASSGRSHGGRSGHF